MGIVTEGWKMPGKKIQRSSSVPVYRRQRPSPLKSHHAACTGIDQEIK
jgi:hypothetical protein